MSQGQAGTGLHRGKTLKPWDILAVVKSFFFPMVSIQIYINVCCMWDETMKLDETCTSRDDVGWSLLPDDVWSNEIATSHSKR